MVKNAPNELKFVPDMYFYEFYQIPEDFLKILKLTDFLPKNDHFACFSRCDFETFFSTENVTTPSKMLRFGWKSVYLLPIMCLTKVVMGFGWFWILATLWAFKVAKRGVYRQNGLKMTKNSHLGNFEVP